jgi:malate dehydrogenase (oxaloacetate-decarboxylating)(NADP+)
MTKSSTNDIDKITSQDALEYHKQGSPGKIAILPTKPLLTQRDLSLAYSPGVAYPCLKINQDPNAAYDYTSKGNLVAVISNGTAVLGLGDLGPLASKPVMEGKAVLFKRFAGIDAIDLEVDTKDTEEFINAIKYLGPSFGGINLEDIKAPECFVIESKLKELMDIPVFHDDQHGTAIITLAALINAAYLTDRELSKIKVVVNGAGAASIACVELIQAMGVKKENVILCDTKGVIYKNRTEGMNKWKEEHAIDTEKRTLAEALEGADVFLGLSVKGAVTSNMVKSMAKNPIIFAMANPDPEITPEEILEVRKDAIIATGRSDYNNQVNNVMGFPYIFRGALDVRASTINDKMKIAAAQAIAQLAREPVPNEVLAAYSGKKLSFGPEYIIPVPFDSRLITTVPIAVAKAAIESGVAKKAIADFALYKRELQSRLNPAANTLNLIFEKAKANQKRIIFADGEEEEVIKAAMSIRDNELGKPILVGRKQKIIETFATFGSEETLDGIEIANAALSTKVDQYIEFLYKKNQRNGLLRRDCTRLVKGDRNIFSACMLACGDGDALLAGHSRNYMSTLDDILKVIDSKPNSEVFGLSVMIAAGRSIFVADSTVHISPSDEQLAAIAIQTAAKAREFGHTPRVAFLSFSNFGGPSSGYERTVNIRKAVEILDKNKTVDFEYDGEMSADVALNEQMRALYPFCRLSKPANVLIMPSLHAANVSSKLLQELGGGTFIGPIIVGLSKPVQIVHMEASVSELINMAVIAAAEGGL